MDIVEHVSLATLTTFKVGGEARYVATCKDIEGIKTAITFARDSGLPWYVLGGGSNILASDEGYNGVVIRYVAEETTFEETESEVIAIADAGAEWDSFVERCAVQGLWGIENLAGIPGTVGAAPVQNIGAYGAEIAQTFAWADVLDANSEEIIRMLPEDCAFAYRESVFKHDKSKILLRVAFTLSKQGSANVSYADIAARIAEGATVNIPIEVTALVRTIRAGKFPDLRVYGTAGSFFKNPVISETDFNLLHEKYPDITSYDAPNGKKISLAWILDKALQLKGFSRGAVRLFEKQPLVLVAESGATANEIDMFAKEIEKKVFDATNIVVEREVQSLR